MILIKPGGLTSPEALAMGKPLVILDPIPGHKAANAGKLSELSRAAAALGKPKAAQAICKEVL
ncbi:MAG: MGDG synthase family glycosyltransferase, partial [Longimicrobiales bacterium]